MYFRDFYGKFQCGKILGKDATSKFMTLAYKHHYYTGRTASILCPLYMDLIQD